MGTTTGGGGRDGGMEGDLFTTRLLERTVLIARALTASYLAAGLFGGVQFNGVESFKNSEKGTGE